MTASVSEPPRSTAEVIEVPFFRLVKAFGYPQAAALRAEGRVEDAVKDLDRWLARFGPEAMNAPPAPPGLRFDRCHF